MKIIRVSYSALANLGDYQNERVGMIANLDADESPEEVIKQLKERVTTLCGIKLRQLRDEEWKLRSAIGDLETKLRSYETQWNAAAEFLRAQGIKPDAPNFPQFTNLLPSVRDESSVVEGEVEDPDEFDPYAESDEDEDEI